MQIDEVKESRKIKIADEEASETKENRDVNVGGDETGKGTDIESEIEHTVEELLGYEEKAVESKDDEGWEEIESSDNDDHDVTEE